MTTKPRAGFHAYSDIEVRTLGEKRAKKSWPPLTQTEIKHYAIERRELSYRFYSHFHPYVMQLVSRFIEKSTPGLLAMDTDYQDKAGGGYQLLPDGKPRPKLYQQIFSSSKYSPSDRVEEPYPIKDLDFTPGGAYSIYNWELFFHAPLAIAIQLSKNHRFQDAQRWFHFIFDPTDESNDPTPERFWKVRPFHHTDVAILDELLVNLSTGADPELYRDTINSICAWKDAPFRPHVIARHRQSAYMYKVVMAYLDNLVAWGDSLFRQDTRESINEATQLYVLAANILGPRPQSVPKKASTRPQTYASIQNSVREFGSVLREIEVELPFALSPSPSEASSDGQLAMLRSIGHSLYFCVPRNDKLCAYWDTVADRLWKIRNSLDLEGRFRQLPLFEPPIDPALLAKAAAASVDVAATLAGFDQPLPLVRFQLLVQKALEVCQEVKSLGSGLLAAMEKGDNETLSVLRAKHERTILALTEVVKYGQWQEAIKTREGLERSLANAAQRYLHYEQLLGRQPGELVLPQSDEFDASALDRKRFSSREPEVSRRKAGLLATPDFTGQTGGRQLSVEEQLELLMLEIARGNLNTAADYEKVGSALGVFLPQPSISVGFSFFVSGSISTPVPPNFSEMFRFIASFFRTDAEKQQYAANKLSKLGSYSRREQDWTLQSNSAAGEIEMLHKQIRAAQIREAVAEREWANHKQQMKHAEEIEQFLTDEAKGKTTNQSFYAWMKRETKGLYGQCYELAFDIARKAELALQRELGDREKSYLQFGHLGGKEGLLAGEKLFLDLKRMEIAYLDANRREYELTASVSVLQIDPMALIRLRARGSCTVALPEELFDLDDPGHYFRRIKSVAVSIPAVTGPNMSVGCTLRLLKSSIRTTPRLDDDSYPRAGVEDSRFDDHLGSTEAIVTSTGQSDSGLFEAKLDDSRYLPFEGSGVLSEWELRLPADPSRGEPQQFDYDTITDVVLHIRYTAREGGSALRDKAIEHLGSRIDAAQTIGSARLFSVRHELPTEWAKLKAAAATNGRFQLVLPLRPEHFPFWSRDRLKELKSIELIAKTGRNQLSVADDDQNIDTLSREAALGGLCIGRLKNVPLPQPVSDSVGRLSLWLDDNELDELWLVVTWGNIVS